MIQFRYGAREAINKAMAATASATSSGGAAAAPSAPAVAMFKSELPSRFQPRPFSDDELEMINLGGAGPYQPKAWKGKK
eukprot:CAMPEP_0174829486 /NCGR_PEP_ID=MMETSP1114-20130205/1953_1 /TAXON_ID=312471 /ORGANISM="Neobodo designis, Strain CCAP 1951/1" /LENGTH=78 /DNA_ID=CAMNT_0016063235 /DNA_START=85 /DNA_END=321 /DNA_ORIENTATION=-